MKFHRVIGKIDPKLVSKAEEALSKVFLELGLRPGNEHIGTALGGDPLIFSLIYPMQHVATLNIPTAATDGKRYFWNPKFVLSKSRTGLRIVCAHEAWHAIYMHPQRRGSRLPKLWNIAVDFIVNGTIMQDIKCRKLDPVVTFKKELGNFITLEGYAEHIKNPFAKIKGSENWVPEPDDGEEEVKLPKAYDDRELTEEERKELEKREAKVKYFYADPNLPEDMRKPEKIYDYLYGLLPKCPRCGKVGMYQFPKSDKTSEDDDGEQGDSEQRESEQPGEEEQEDESQNHDHDHSDSDQSCNHPSSSDNNSTPGDGEKDGDQGCCPSNKPGSEPGCCDSCGGGYDIFDFGDTLDDHMDADESQEKMAKRIADAMEAAKKMAGSVPGSLEDELEQLMAPKIRWQDFLRAKISKVRDGNSKNDWTRFRTRPLFAGLMVPKRVNQVCTFGCLLDTSGSMSVTDMTFGVSQLQSIDERSEGWIVPADATIYWKDATKLKRVSPAEICKIKIMGRGGTKYAQFFSDYKKEMGNVDFLIMITDGYLDQVDIAEMVNPGIDVVWLVTSGTVFNAPFGRVFSLKD